MAIIIYTSSSCLCIHCTFTYNMLRLVMVFAYRWCFTFCASNAHGMTVECLKKRNVFLSSTVVGFAELSNTSGLLRKLRANH